MRSAQARETAHHVGLEPRQCRARGALLIFHFGETAANGVAQGFQIVTFHAAAHDDVDLVAFFYQQADIDPEISARARLAA